jgi:hypothetical protein
MRQDNMRYRPARFGGPVDEPFQVPDEFLAQANVNWLDPETVAAMVLEAVRENRPFVLDHTGYENADGGIDLRQVFAEHYVDYVLSAFDEVEAFERRAQGSGGRLRR